MVQKEIEQRIRNRIKQSKDKSNKSPYLGLHDLTSVDFNKNELEKNVNDNNYTWDIVNDRITSHRKIIGKLIVFGKKVVRKLLHWHVTQPLHLQREFNGSVTRSINELYKFNLHMEERVNQLIEGIDRKNNQLFEVTEQKHNGLMDELERKHIQLLDIVEQKHNHLIEKVLFLEQKFQQNQDIIHSISELYKINSKFEEKQTQLLEKIQYFDGIIEEVNKNINSEQFDIDYLEFENEFRGSEEHIKQKQLEQYLPYLDNKKRILDIGCGRGEFIEVLAEKNFEVTGIDVNEKMIKKCKEKGLNVYREDAYEYLERIPDNYFDAIFSLHVFEHLPQKMIVDLIRLCERKLKKDGLMIMETPNPECLLNYAYGFSIDLTHRKILHPYTMKFLFEKNGFKDVRVKHLSLVEDNARLKYVTSTDEFVINDNIEKLNRLLFGYQDYAIIATKEANEYGVKK